MTRLIPDGECGKCRAPTRTVITTLGKVRDLDVVPDAERGNHVIVDAPGRLGQNRTLRAAVLTGDRMPAPEGTPAYRMHECARTPALAPGPACAVCGLPMDRELAALEHWTEHPSCDPDHPPPGGLRVR